MRSFFKSYKSVALLAALNLACILIVVAADCSHQYNMAIRYKWENYTPQSFTGVIANISLKGFVSFFAPYFLLAIVKNIAIRIIAWIGGLLLLAWTLLSAPQEFFNQIQDSGGGILLVAGLIQAATMTAIFISTSIIVFIKVIHWTIRRIRIQSVEAALYKSHPPAKD